MSLVDFMQQLQEQDNLVYSEVPEPSIRVIPPEKSCTKIIPPESMSVKPPTIIKLKINQKTINVNNQVPNVDNVNNIEQPKNSILKSPPKQVEQQTQHIEEKQPKTNNKKSISEDDLFISSGTELSKKSIWLEYYSKAKSSRKSNQIVERMKIGRFTITPDNKVLLLPDYDIVGKDPDDVLKDKWF